MLNVKGIIVFKLLNLFILKGVTMIIEPQKVEVFAEGISIIWKDSHKSFFESKYLRINCSCAQCVEEWTNRQLLDPATVPQDIQALDYLWVGRYALQFLWSDTHSTGIYPFTMLRNLCICDDCQSLRKTSK